MGDTFYRICRMLGRPAFAVSSRVVVIGSDLIPAAGPVLIVCTHSSPFDVPILIRHSPRILDFISSTELFANPLVAAFMGAMNAFPLDRSGPDARTALIAARRLQNGRAVAMFPEGRICRGRESVLEDGTVRTGFARLAAAGGAQVVPAVVLGAECYSRWTNWLPLRRTRYGVIFGSPLNPDPEIGETLVGEFRRLRGVLQGQMQRGGVNSSPFAADSRATE